MKDAPTDGEIERGFKQYTKEQQNDILNDMLYIWIAGTYDKEFKEHFADVVLSGKYEKGVTLKHGSKPAKFIHSDYTNPSLVCKAEQAIREMMQMVADGKSIVISPDFGVPYTLKIADSHGNVKHTHNSYTYGDGDEDDIRRAVESFINHILGESGLSFSEDE